MTVKEETNPVPRPVDDAAQPAAPPSVEQINDAPDRKGAKKAEPEPPTLPTVLPPENASQNAGKSLIIRVCQNKRDQSVKSANQLSGTFSKPSRTVWRLVESCRRFQKFLEALRVFLNVPMRGEAFRNCNNLLKATKKFKFTF